MAYLSFRKLISLPILSVLAVPASAQTNNNTAYQDNQVRITLITDGVARLEWQPDGKFVDNKSFIAVNRYTPHVADFKVNKTKKYVEITTTKMKIKYLRGSGKFTASNLSITSPKHIAIRIEYIDGTVLFYDNGGFDTLSGNFFGGGIYTEWPDWATPDF